MGKQEEELLYVWQDKRLKFDVPKAYLGLTKGEFLIDSINSVEDTKGFVVNSPFSFAFYR